MADESESKGASPKQSGVKPLKQSGSNSGSGQVDLRYLGSSDELNDVASGKVFQAGGEAQRVSERDAARLEAIPGEKFERVETAVRK